MKYPALLIILLLVFTVIAAAVDDASLSQKIYATLLVPEPERAAEELIIWADNHDGYVLIRSSDMVVLRFPRNKTGNFRTYLEESSEDVFDVSVEAYDMTEEILSLESGIQARQEILDKNLSFIDRADIEGTLAIEREVMRLLTELESMRGRLNKIKVDTAMAWAQVSFTFKDESLPQDIPSSFAWINHIDFYRFLQGSF